MTQAGMILGTAAYMAPEQARGKTVDKRADIWAFGAVLFEMLTGTRAFGGEDVTETLAAVVRAEPNWTLLPAGLPPTLGVYLKRCLQKDPKAADADIGDVRLALEGAFETAAPQTTPLAAATPRSVVARALPWALVGNLRHRADRRRSCCGRPGDRRPCPRRASCSPASAPTRRCRPPAARRRFCRRTARRSRSSRGRRTQTRLFIRNLDQLQATALAGTEGAESPFFSPDGQWLAFFAGGTLKKISVTGGAAVTLCNAPQGLRRHVGQRRHDPLRAFGHTPERR